MDTAKISKFLKKQIPTASLLIQGLLYMGFGALLIFRQQMLATLTVALVSAFFGLQAVIGIWVGLLRLPFHPGEGGVRLAGGLANGGAAALILWRPQLLLGLLPLLVALSSFLNFISSIVTFFQYRREPSTQALRSLLAALVSGALTLWLLFSLWQRIDFAMLVAGIFLVLYGISVFFDFISEILPPATKSRLKRHVHISLPVYWAAFFPRRALAGINRYFETDGADIHLLSAEKANTDANVEIFIHVAEEGNGAIGHVDMRIEEQVISYGGYDEAAMKLGGGMGPGVLFQHSEKEKYIAFCEAHSGKTLFGFGLHLEPEEVAAMKDKLQEILADSYEWTPSARRAEQGELPPGEYTDYASALYLATGARFFKFRSGSFRHYFVLGTNCVKLADTLLRASGSATVATGIIAPGTYYDFLNREFMRAGSNVVSRTVYYDTSLDHPADG